MSKYLKISSPVETSPEAFTVLGASSARGNEDSIGQFGSGAKHAVLCALRAGLTMLIYCGRTKIVPQSTPQIIHGVEQQRVSFRIGNKTEQSSMVLDFGSLDWTNPVPMMLRELISNALDAVGGDWSQVVIEEVDKPRAKAGYTTIYVQMNHEIREYLSSLHRFFLHIDGEHEKRLLPQNPGACRFYRKGVFVHELQDSLALYSYNCDGSLPIDESRNLDSSRVRRYAAELLTQDVQATKHVLSVIEKTGDKYYESGFSSWNLRSNIVYEAAVELWGSDACVTDCKVTYSRCKAKGLNVHLIVGASGWHTALLDNLPDAASLLSKADAAGLSVFEPSEQLVRNVRFVWSHFVACELNGSCELPPCFEFEKPLNASMATNGFYDSKAGAIYIHREHTNNFAAIIEELAHHVTGANDETRDFQDFAFRFCGLLMKG